MQTNIVSMKHIVLSHSGKKNGQWEPWYIYMGSDLCAKCDEYDYENLGNGEWSSISKMCRTLYYNVHDEHTIVILTVCP